MNNKISNLDQVCYIRRYTITSNKEEGVKVIELYNGTLRVLLNESKALDIMQLFYKGANLSFISKNGFSTKENDFIKRFEGGMLYTVGLDVAGKIDNYPLHGTFHNLKPTVTRLEANEKGIIVEANIADTELFGKNLLMKRRYIIDIYSSKFILQDKLINLGKVDEKYCLLYHNNIGYPFLDSKDQIEINYEKVEPRTDYAKQMIKFLNQVDEPTDVIDETCYFLKIKDGKASLINNKLKKKFTITFNNSLKEFVLWKSFKSQDYALGFEPSTTKLDDKFKYLTIKPNQEIDFELSYCIEDL